MSLSEPTVALIGNPNCGKTALFNALTGSSARVGNWPGVTVDQHYGSMMCEDQTIRVVDLPGVYSLLTLTAERARDESIASTYLRCGEADLFVNVLDAANLERNLFLTTQLLDMRRPVIVVVNMLDILKRRGAQIDLAKLSSKLGCPVIGMVASKGHGVDLLTRQIGYSLSQPQSVSPIPYPSNIESGRAEMAAVIEPAVASNDTVMHCLAIRCLEGDYLAQSDISADLKPVVARIIDQVEHDCESAIDIEVADARFRYAHEVSNEVIVTERERKLSMTDRIDRVVLNRWAGVPIFFGVMYLMFLVAVNLGSAFQDFFDIGSSVFLVDGLAHLLLSWHAPTWLVALLADGVGKGVNTTLTFIPVIGSMFLCLSFLEDCGYMARAAFVMDRMMSWLGLPGRSFVPMIIGFGCNVPAVMGARTLANPRDRILTVMMMPFMSCGARLAIFSVFASAFFKGHSALLVFSLYLFGIVVAVFTGFLLRKTVLKGESESLVMELPAYHVPKLWVLCRHAGQRLRVFLLRAGKVIVPVCMLVGCLNSITVSGHIAEPNQSEPTLLSVVGEALTPALAPMGITPDNWPATVGLFTGVLAKEVVVGTLNTLYVQQAHLTLSSNEDFNFKEGIMDALQSIPDNLLDLADAWKNPIESTMADAQVDAGVYGIMARKFGGTSAAFAYVLFVLLYFPCISTLAIMRREVGRGWANFSMAWSCSLAYVLAVLSYQVLTWSSHPYSSFAWVASLLALFFVFVYMLRAYAHNGRFLHFRGVASC